MNTKLNGKRYFGYVLLLTPVTAMAATAVGITGFGMVGFAGIMGLGAFLLALE